MRGTLHGAHVGVDGEVEQLLVDVDVAEHVQAVGGGLAEAIDELVVLGGAQRLLEPDVGVGLEQPEVGALGLIGDQLTAERDGVGVATLLEEAAGEAHLPVQRLRIEQNRHAVGGLGGELVVDVRHRRSRAGRR